MLHHLHIKNFALIENLEIDFSPGFHVFTGETGAGKTIILNALNLVLGERASADLLRPGTDKLEVTAVFESESGELILKREIAASGKSLAKINGEIVPLSQLKQLGDTLVDLHGQHEHQSLLHVERHLEFLDAYAQSDDLVSEAGQRYQTLRGAKQDYQKLQTRKQESESKLDFLRFQLQEIEALRLQADEDKLLEQERQILRHAETLHDHARTSREALQTADSALRNAKLAEIAHIDPGMNNCHDQWNQLLYSLEELHQEIRTYLHKVDVNPHRLQDVEDRLAAIHHLQRKYGGTIADILAKQHQLAAEIETVEFGEEKLQELHQVVQQAEAAYQKVVRTLSGRRQEKARQLEQALLRHLQDLSMEKTSFQVDFQPGNPGPRGTDQVEFLISPNPGQPLRPLAKIASGGEISRLMLALKTVLLQADPVGTMIFDEIDTGIGGKTASAVGEKLQGLASQRQILCITHLPSIACFAEKHFVVQKSQTAQSTEITVHEIKGLQRQEEIARMLSGQVTETTLQHAAELLERT